MMVTFRAGFNLSYRSEPVCVVEPRGRTRVLTVNPLSEILPSHISVKSRVINFQHCAPRMKLGSGEAVLLALCACLDVMAACAREAPQCSQPSGAAKLVRYALNVTLNRVRDFTHVVFAGSRGTFAHDGYTNFDGICCGEVGAVV